LLGVVQNVLEEVSLILGDFHKAQANTIGGVLLAHAVKIRPDYLPCEFNHGVIRRHDPHPEGLIEAKGLLNTHGDAVETNVSGFSFDDPVIREYVDGSFQLVSWVFPSFGAIFHGETLGMCYQRITRQGNVAKPI